MLEPGDLLFIPIWWLHTFSHLGALNANVNFWWKPVAERDNAVTRWEREIEQESGARRLSGLERARPNVTALGRARPCRRFGLEARE